jgi:dihydroorotase
MSKLLIKNGTVINPGGAFGEFDILIEDGLVARLDESIDETADRVIDASGLYVSPGFIDMHCHLREPGYEYKEDIRSGTAAAAKGGFTAVVCMPNTDPVVDNASVVRSILKTAADAAGARVYPVGCITRGMEGKELAPMGELLKAGAIAFSDDGKPVMDNNVMKMALQYAKNFGALIISHCEDLTLTGGGVMNEGEISAMLGLRGVPAIAEEIHISRELLLAEYLDTRVHIAHVSTACGVNMIREAKERGVKVSAETAPHYICSTDELVDGFNTLAKVNPPLRTETDRLAVVKGLLDGTIDCIATDHAPHHADEKNVEFDLAASGIDGFETAFAVAYTVMCVENDMPPEELIGLMSVAPAEILGVRGGVIEEGALADITIFDVEKHTIEADAWISKSRNSPYIGQEFFGGIVYTVVNGNVVYELGVRN